VGTVIVRNEGEKDVRLFVEEGFVKITPGEVVVLAENGEDLGRTNQEKIEKEIKTATADLNKASGESEKESAQNKLNIATLKMQAIVSPYYLKS
jgi:F0F1-type ATP synthase epsilon subunit